MQGLMITLNCNPSTDSKFILPSFFVKVKQGSNFKYLLNLKVLYPTNFSLEAYNFVKYFTMNTFYVVLLSKGSFFCIIWCQLLNVSYPFA